MTNLKRFLKLASLPLLVVSCDNFELIGTKTAEPANVKIDFVVQKPSKNIRPVGLTPDLYLSQVDLKSFKITEDGKKLSLSEGGKAGVEKCGDCSANLVKLTLDYSGSVRNQYETLIQNAISFIENLKNSQGITLVNVSFFAGDAGLYEIMRENLFTDPNTMINFLKSRATCDSFKLKKEIYSVDEPIQTLCEADTATRLNTAILKTFDAFNEPHIYGKSINGKKLIKTAILFTDGMGRDKGVTVEQVKSGVTEFRNKGGLFYSVTMDSDEDNAKFFKEINPTKRFTLKKLDKLSEKLNDVLEDVQEETPFFFTLKVCSAVRGGPTTLKVSSRKYKVPEITINYDTSNFRGGCDLKNKQQWNF